MRFEGTPYGTIYVWTRRPRIPFNEAYEWYNYVQDSYNGRNQVTRFRNAPRHYMEIESPIPQVDINNVYALLHAYKSEKWGMPSWADYQTISIASGSTSLPGGYTVDERIPYVLVQDQYKAEVLFFNEGVFDALENDYVNALLMPLRIGRIITSADTYNNTISGNASFAFQSSVNVDYDIDEPTQYDGHDVYTDTCSLFTSPLGIRDTIITRMDSVDGITGLVNYNSPWLCSRRERDYRVYNDTQAEYKAFKDFLYRRGGRYRPFWLPTWNGDLTLESTGALTTSIVVSESGFSFCRSDIAVRKTNGDWLFRKVTEAIQDSDNIVLTLDTSLGINAEDIERISYLGLHRLGTDRVEIGHISNQKSLCTIPIVELSIA
jgi:hypothetical protein